MWHIGASHPLLHSEQTLRILECFAEGLLMRPKRLQDSCLLPLAFSGRLVETRAPPLQGYAQPGCALPLSAAPKMAGCHVCSFDRRMPELLASARGTPSIGDACERNQNPSIGDACECSENPAFCRSRRGASGGGSCWLPTPFAAVGSIERYNGSSSSNSSRQGDTH